MKRLAVAAAILLALAACNRPAREDGGNTPAPSPSSTLPPITVRSRGSAKQPVRIVEAQNNHKLYELQASSTQSNLQSQNAFHGTFVRAHITFYGKTGTLTGDAPLATIDKATQRVTLQGGVHARTSDGITLQCDKLSYDRSNGQLSGTGNVHIVTSQGYALTGGSFQSDLQLTNVRMR